jgi:hypothetical protein
MKRLIALPTAIFLITVLWGVTDPDVHTLQTRVMISLQFLSPKVLEPASIVLLSLVLLGCTTIMRRHRLHRQPKLQFSDDLPTSQMNLRAFDCIAHQVCDFGSLESFTLTDGSVANVGRTAPTPFPRPAD